MLGKSVYKIGKMRECNKVLLFALPFLIKAVNVTILLQYREPYVHKGLFIQNTTTAWRRSRRNGLNKTN